MRYSCCFLGEIGTTFGVPRSSLEVWLTSEKEMELVCRLDLNFVNISQIVLWWKDGEKVLWLYFHFIFHCGPCMLHGPWVWNRTHTDFLEEDFVIQIKICISEVKHISIAARQVQSQLEKFMGSSCGLSLLIRNRTYLRIWHNRFTQCD